MLKYIKSIMRRKYLSSRNIIVDKSSKIPRTICVDNVSDEHKITVINSSIGNIKFSEGCKFVNCTVTGNVELGRFVSINGPSTTVTAKINRISIGNFVSIAQNTVIQEFNHRTDKISSYFMSRNIFGDGLENDIASKGNIIIEDDVWLGANCTIVSGVTIGRGSVIGAGSVVTKDIPQYSIAGGVPAKVIKKRFTAKTIAYLESIKWWEWTTQQLIDKKELFNMSIEGYEKEL